MKFSDYSNISLEYHATLNPKIFDLVTDNAEPSMWPDVRAKLLELANVWREFAKIDSEWVKDIICTGGNANFNYTSQSDLDVHLVIDYNKIANNPAFIREYMMDKKALWADNHPDIKVKGYSVEIFAQPLEDQPHAGQGIYSLLLNQWQVSPSNEHLDFTKDPILLHKVEFYEKRIDDLIENKSTDMAVLQKLKDKLKGMRSAGIEKAGEFSIENLVFKELRNDGYLQKLSNYMRQMFDAGLSLESFKLFVENHHCEKKICDGCGTVITCRCRTPKTVEVHTSHCHNCA